jgi:hypothetical protein
MNALNRCSNGNRMMNVNSQFINRIRVRQAQVENPLDCAFRLREPLGIEVSRHRLLSPGRRNAIVLIGATMNPSHASWQQRKAANEKSNG